MNQMRREVDSSDFEMMKR